MNRDQLQAFFTQPYDRTAWLKTIHSVFPHTELFSQPQSVPVGDSRAKSVFQLGNTRLAGDRGLALIEVTVNETIDLARNRVGLRNLVARFIDQDKYHGVLAVFRSPQPEYRFTFATRETAFDDVGQIVKRETAPRRYTYLLGPTEACRTPAERFALLAAKQDAATMADLIAAFSVETVTKEFYEEISNWYFWARELAVFPPDAPTDSDGKPSLSIIRLLTRLIFCWFLRRKQHPQTGKGLLPDILFDEQRIHTLLKNTDPEACTYYPAVLQNLFFATLNTEMDKPREKPSRRFIEEGDGQRSDDHMIHTFWRHERLLRDPEAFAELLRAIPFLNGGLFECLDDRVPRGKSSFTDEIRIDGFSNDPKKQPKLPNFLFFGKDQFADLASAYGDSTRKHERVRPLLAILQRYNFTLTESTPLDQEVALDPELLGHVFENLLAAYNPETGTVARKATGSFYTPRVGVDWMVDQALIVYFGKALDRVGKAAKSGHNERLQRLLSWEETGHDFSAKEVESLIDAIDQLKALDPACGSGAFPMGLLQKLVHVLRKLDPENKGWRRRQQVAIETIESSTAREEALRAIERAFARDNDDYGRKLFLIENCLYGVDIQPIACQIAKLRFFISLICDQTIDPNEPNYGILPLPNLETKIVAANTLLGLQRGQLLLGSDKVRKLERDLQQVRHDYFTARSYRNKKALRARDKELCAELATALTDSGECSPYDSKRLAEWNPYDTNTHAQFFDPAWMFGLPAAKDAGGVFHIVIGNPPYVRQEELKNQTVFGSDGKPRSLKDALKDQYECYTGTADLYVYFFERSLQLLTIGGVLSFITSNKYFRAAYGERLRTYLAWATRPQVVLDFGDAPLFTSVAYPAILVTEKTRHVNKGKLPPSEGPYGILHATNLPPEDWHSHVLCWTPGPGLNDFPDVFAAQSQALSQRDLKPDGWRLESPVNLRLIERLHKAGKPLGEYVKGRLYRGVITGLNEVFVVPRDTRDDLIAKHKSSAEVLKPFLRGRDVKRWRCEFAEQHLIRIESSENVNHPWTGKSEKEAERIFAKTYPAIHEYFELRRKDLIKRYDQGHFFWELRSCDFWHEFEQPKIVVPAIEDEVNYAPDDGKYFSNDKTSIIIPPSIPFTLAITNSAISWWITRQSFASKQGGFYEFKPMYVSQLPIPAATPEQQRQCERLAEALIWLHRPGVAKKADDAPVGLMTAYFEQWLNGLVYELFFPGELHARKLKLFDETARVNPPDLSAVAEKQKLATLQELFTNAYDAKAPVRAMLHDLPSLDVVRIIEDASS